jgi:3',5'-cyclic AMP phosphodiesterase CpdA
MREIIKRMILLSILLLIILPTLGSAMPNEDRFTLEGKSQTLKKEKPIDKIKFPLSSLPVIVKQGDSFSIRVDLSPLDEENLNVVKWKAGISTAYDKFVVSYSLLIESIEVKDKLFSLQARVPKKAAVDLYNLTVSARVNGKEMKDSQPRAVSVVSEIKDSFTFIQVTDPHCWDIRTWLASPGKTLGDKLKNFTKSEAYNETIKEVNLIHPDFVLLTGDFIGGPLIGGPYPSSLLSPERQYETAYELLQCFDVPTFLIPGNHDGYIPFFIFNDGLKLYKEYFGEYYYSFEYGDSHFTMLNSYDWPILRRTILNAGGRMGNEQLRWLEGDLSNAQEAKLRFVCLHHNSLEKGKHGMRRTEPFFDLISEANVTMILAGHVHKDSKRVINDTIFLTTTSCATVLSYGYDLSGLGLDLFHLTDYFILLLPREEPNPLTYNQYWGFRQVKVEDGKIESYAYDEEEKSIPTYRLSVNYSEDREKASIKSGLEIPLEVKVDLDTKDKDYKIIGGELLWEREINEIKILTCKVEVPPNSFVEVEVVEVTPLPKPFPLTFYLSILLSIIVAVLLICYLLKLRRERKKRRG